VTRKSHLSAVPDDGKPAKPPRRRRAQTVAAAAANGDQLDLLIALRKRIAGDIDSPNTPARDLAALSRRLLEIAREIEALTAAEEGDGFGAAAATPDEEWPSS